MKWNRREHVIHLCMAHHTFIMAAACRFLMHCRVEVNCDLIALVRDGQKIRMDLCEDIVLLTSAWARPVLQKCCSPTKPTDHRRHETLSHLTYRNQPSPYPHPYQEKSLDGRGNNIIPQPGPDQRPPEVTILFLIISSPLTLHLPITTIRANSSLPRRDHNFPLKPQDI